MTCSGSAERERRAFRVAGQAVGAILVGAPIDRVCVEVGTRILWSNLRPGGAARRSDTRPYPNNPDGVGAQQRYAFGLPPDDVVWLMPRADESGLRDIEEADAASIELSDATGAGLEAVWRYAAEIIGHDDVWQAVEAVAEELLDGQLDARQMARLCCSED